MNNVSNKFSDKKENEQDSSASSSFNQHWDLSTDHSVHIPSTSELAASHSVLDSLKKRRGLETAQWLNQLAGQISLDKQSASDNQQSSTSNQELNQTNHDSLNISGQPAQTSMQQSVREWLDKMFDHFERYASRFNETARGTDLIVNYARPLGADKHKSQGYGVTSNQTVNEDIYEGHLATRFWAMLFRGSLGKIEVFVIPAEKLLSFSTQQMNESAYSPLLTIESNWQNGQLRWHIAQTIISIDQVSLLAKELFGDLIRVASGQMSESELFAHPMQEMCLGENLAIGYQSPQGTADQLVLPLQTTPISLQSLNASTQLLVSIDEDIKQLFALGKTALQADNKDLFQKIKTLATDMETYKQSVLDRSAQIRQSIEQIELTNAPVDSAL